ncbi:MAG: methyltransferase domain-containing protein [Candidatus Odinarchaeia archaeon]
MYVVEEPVNDEVLFEISRGMISYIRRLITQIGFSEGLHEILFDYKDLIEISDILNCKNLKLLRTLLVELTNLHVLKQRGDTFKWQGGEIKVSDEERKFENLSDSWAILLQWFSKRFRKLIKGDPPISTREVGIWDSIYSSPLYQYIWKRAIEDLNLDEESVILEVGCKTGWGTLNILSNYNPKLIIAVEPNENFIEVAQENIKIFSADSYEKVIFINQDFKDEFNISEYTELTPNKVVVSLVFHWYTPQEHLIILNNLRKVLGDEVQVVFLQPHVSYRNEPRFYELLLCSEEDFKGYPILENFANQLISSGFEILKRDFNLYIQTLTGEPKNKEFKISPDPPKFCEHCGGILQKNTFYCAYCRNIITSNLHFTLL